MIIPQQHHNECMMRWNPHMQIKTIVCSSNVNGQKLSVDKPDFRLFTHCFSLNNCSPNSRLSCDMTIKFHFLV